MTVSLIITTYNWKEALDAVLKSVTKQIVLPDEVIVADDGSKIDTKKLIESWQKIFPVPLIHSWQEDDGFRAAQSRNKAIAKANSDFIVMIDGDMVLSKKFISDYKESAKIGYFIQGGRVITDKECSEKIISSDYIPHFFTKGIKNRKNTISCSFLSKLFSFERNSDKGTRTCNFGCWKKDLIEVNGFNNDFVGWGREDSEFVIRMLNAGKKRLYLKFVAVAFHLYHNENARASLKENDKLLQETIDKKLIFCENGINKYLVKEENE
ncbi:family 2 glycosyl transferase [Arcobacter sp. FW59]|nr:family 2 glycosyl transferase [Arcobacter sp. FW59]